MVRKWLAAMLRNETPEWPFPDSVSYESILDSANAEGVIGLLNECINSVENASRVPAEFKEQLSQLARTKALQSLMREAECRRILACLHQAGIETLLLKGSALAYWAYPSAHLRECSDIDLLFASHAETKKAIDLLISLHYSLRDPVLAGDLVSFEQTCVRHSDRGSGLEIDLHWRLSSSPIFAFQFGFDELSSNAITLAKLGEHARGLSPVHAFFNACMHRVQNMADGTENVLKWLYDLHLLGLKFTPSDWQLLGKMAIERKLAGTCYSGLQAARLEFDTTIPANVFNALAEAAKREQLNPDKMQRWFYIQCMSFLSFPTMAMGMRWFRQRLLPDAKYLHARYGGSTNIFSLVLKRILAGLQRLIRF